MKNLEAKLQGFFLHKQKKRQQFLISVSELVHAVVEALETTTFTKKKRLPFPKDAF
ncbi:MAG: hypothetical protein UHP28_05855 [Treponema sp.]|nr:hypothetical protein [Treponema sp.]